MKYLALYAPLFLKVMKYIALAGVSKWLEYYPKHQQVAGLIPSQGTYLGCGFVLDWGMY